MMKINHLNLTVTDVAASRAFLETYFGLDCRAARGDNFAVLFDDDGFVLTLMKGREVQYPKTFHVGFPQPTEEQVDRINQRLLEDGYDVKPPQHAHGYTFYVEAPGGFTVEVLC
ncbi:catechol 2,3-dioxygenase-like lactoylglutathione lyase family enzyme [Paenibacillus rhizosphaerae]|uniref:Catechol 2,3-dioxygenase-like lactoylglutathione lyase family enzyme n=2 Tax=Paenibacillus rhizosphaerae TaxID=297318 RepID=A0A839TWA8_9BACL|nr:catechol 2,3-dioxygenase-like lactoylglutathione lyase family enzyme [Paenibacillus rhizosphaerae]